MKGDQNLRRAAGAGISEVPAPLCGVVAVLDRRIDKMRGRMEEVWPSGMGCTDWDAYNRFLNRAVKLVTVKRRIVAGGAL